MRRIALLFLVAAATTASGQVPPTPVTTLQTQPISRILVGVRQVAGHFGGPNAAAALDQQLAAKLGPKGLQGLDLDRPVTGYTLIKPGVLQQPVVILVPITDRANVLDLLKRASVEAEPSDVDKDVYQIAIDNPQISQVLLRFHNNAMYVALNAEPVDLDPKKLPTAASLTTPNQGAWLTYTTRMDQLTEADRKTLTEATDRVGDMMAGMPLPPAMKQWYADYMKVVLRYNTIQMEQGKKVTQIVDLDPKTLQFTLDYFLAPKSSTPLAKDLAGYKPTDNHFAAIVGPDSVAGVVTKFPLFIPELRSGTAELLGLARDNLKQLPFKEEALDALEAPAGALLTGMARAAKKGRIDLAAAVRGPSAAGFYNAAAAVSCNGTAELDAAVHKWHAGLTPEHQGAIKLDVYKAKGVAVHQFQFGLNLIESKIWGDKAVACIALTETGVLVTFGVDSLNHVKALIDTTQKPKPAAVLDLQVNLKRLRSFGLLYGYGFGPALESIPTTTKDELRTFAKLTVAGGDELTIKLLMDLGLIPAAK